MAFTSADVEALEQAIASGVLRVVVNGRETTYRDTESLKLAYDLAKRQVESCSRPSLRRGRYNPYYDS